MNCLCHADSIVTCYFIVIKNNLVPQVFTPLFLVKSVCLPEEIKLFTYFQCVHVALSSHIKYLHMMEVSCS